MKQTLLIIASALLLLSCNKTAQQATIERDQDFNFGWKFSLDQEGDAFAADLADSSWRTVNVPHDWSAEFEFDSIQGEGCTGYLLGGIGWYRKHFTVDFNPSEKVYVHFDGVYNNSELWINGEKLGEHPYGYSPFYFDITPFLKAEGNVIAVKVDRTRYADSRWYTGSGIYRNVKLVKTNKLHVPIWGTYIQTPKVSKEEATINVSVRVANDFDTDQAFTLTTDIFNSAGVKVATLTHDATAKTGETTIDAETTLSNPELWGIETPTLYKAVTSLSSNGKLVDQYKTTFGIRSIRFDKETGFYLNEENMKIKGVCLHHDAGLVGAAVPKAVWKRRLEQLKETGCNALRISHNPSSEELLELCDEMGFLVQDEFFDEWDFPKDKRKNMKEQSVDYITRGYGEHFHKWNKFDLTNTVLCHRNHPSVFQWSIGNEIEWTYPENAKATGFFGNMDWSGNYFWSQPPIGKEKIREVFLEEQAKENKPYQVGKTAQMLSDWTKELDKARPVVANCILPSASFESGYADALDIVGFSYRQVMYDYARKFYPEKTIMGTENLPQYHEWKAIMERPFVSGTFLWTGFDYLGERNESWPSKATASGLFDLAGFEKPGYHMYRTLWNDEPHVHIYTNNTEVSKYKVDESGAVVAKDGFNWEQALWFWYDVEEHWNYNDNETVIVEVFSNCEEVELFLNNESLGTKKLASFPDHIYKWAVPFKAGTLTAKAVKNNKPVEMSIATASEATKVKITVDKTELTADGYDVAHVTLQLVDSNGNPVKKQEKTITIDVDGAVKALGVDNGFHASVQKYQSNTITTNNGRALLIVQSTLKQGSATITASSEGLETNSTTLSVK